MPLSGSYGPSNARGESVALGQFVKPPQVACQPAGVIRRQLQASDDDRRAKGILRISVSAQFLRGVLYERCAWVVKRSVHF